MILSARVFRGLHVAFALALAATLGAQSREAAKPKLKLTLKGIPTVGGPGTVFTFQGILTGGPDDETLHCLTAEWIWEVEADSSLNESECEPFKAGETRIQRSFSEEQSFSRPGDHVVKLVLHKGEKDIATATARVTVRPR